MSFIRIDLLEKMKTIPNTNNSKFQNSDGIDRQNTVESKENKYAEADYTQEQLDAVKRIKR